MITILVLFKGQNGKFRKTERCCRRISWLAPGRAYWPDAEIEAGVIIVQISKNSNNERLLTAHHNLTILYEVCLPLQWPYRRNTTVVLTNSIIFTKLRPGRKLENSQNNVSKSSTVRLFFLKTNTSSIDA